VKLPGVYLPAMALSYANREDSISLLKILSGY
jgi:hypothetical protein